MALCKYTSKQYMTIQQQLTDSKPAATRLLTLRRSPILLKLPPYLSALCIVVGIAWLLVLPLNEYSRQTYISENAILPGQVHTHFGGSEHNVFRAYRQEVYALSERPEEERVGGLEQVLSDQGLKVATQPYRYEVAGEVIAGTNVYGVLQGPRADATEAMVLMAGWYNVDGKTNYSGVALALALGRYFKRWSIWSKDIIILIAADSTYGPEAWVSAYHSTLSEPTSSRNVSSLAIRAGALQGAVALDYPAGPWGHRFDKIDILYDGINGALPNLDLLNTAVHVASSQNGVGSSVHGVSKHADNYQDRVKALLRGIVTQSAGHATGPHSAFMPYHVDAITLKTVGNGWHDEMSLGRVTESLMRSINNLLEHFHQSFFFYILLNANRFVSIGTYLPSAMIVAGSFTINALALWLQSGKAPAKKAASPKDVKKHQEPRMDVIKEDGEIALVPHVALESVERKLALPALCLIAIHFAGLIPLYLLNNTSIQVSSLCTNCILILADILHQKVPLRRLPCHFHRLLPPTSFIEHGRRPKVRNFNSTSANLAVFLAHSPRRSAVNSRHSQLQPRPRSGAIGDSTGLCTAAFH